MAGAITVYAAASLIGTFDEIAATFASTYPDAFAVVTYDSSAAIAAGVAKGSKIDLFASADSSQMDKLQTDELMQAPEVVFATDVFEIVVAPGNPILGVAATPGQFGECRSGGGHCGWREQLSCRGVAAQCD